MNIVQGYIAEEWITPEAINEIKKMYRIMIKMDLEQMSEDIKSNLNDYIENTNEPYWEGRYAKSSIEKLEEVIAMHRINFPESEYRIMKANIVLDAYKKWKSYEVIVE